MAVTWTDVRDLPSGEFSALSQSVIKDALEESALLLNADYLGARYDMAIKYLAAHFLATEIGGSKGVEGPTTSKNAGPFSLGKGGSLIHYGAKDQWDSTAYGRRVKSILKSLRFKAPRIV